MANQNPCYIMDKNQSIRIGIEEGIFKWSGNNQLELVSHPGVMINYKKNYTFASKNSNILVNKFWANPREDILNEDWILVLNDTASTVLHYFFIPKGKLSITNFKTRSLNNKNKLIINIPCNNTNFPNNGIDFYKFKEKLSVAYKLK